METSCTKLARLLYTFLDYFHSDAGTLGVLFDALKSQPPTAKVRFQTLLDELTSRSPMMDIVYEELEHLDYLRTLLDCILMYCSNTLYLVTSICLQAKISDPNFEIQLYQDLWVLMEKYQVTSRNELNRQHDEYVKKWSLACKPPTQRFETMKKEAYAEVEDLIKAGKLPEKQANEIKEFVHMKQEEQQNLLVNELSKLTFMEKPIVFAQGKLITMKGEDLIVKLQKLLFIDEQKIQWFMNIRTAETFLNQTLQQLRKTIQFRYRWKDKDLWFEWLKNQYKEATNSLTVLPQEVVPLGLPKAKLVKENQIKIVKDQEAAMRREMEDENEWIHCKTLNWIKNKNNQEILAESQKEVRDQWKQNEGNQ
jgi:hypothetical protein